MSLDDSLRRICNQAFFDRISVYEVEITDTVHADPEEAFDTLFPAPSTRKHSPTKPDARQGLTLSPIMSRV